VYQDDRQISGKKLIPRLSVGCIVFTVVGLLGTWGIAQVMTAYKIYPHFGSHQIPRKP
jgi:hypothetical protein